MKVLIKQFLGKNHSWSVCGWGIATALLKAGHQVDLFSTDGIKNLPKHLSFNLIGYVEENINDKIYGRLPTQTYDCQISYTSMKNFPFYLSNGNKNRFGIWCYEWAGKNILPTGFAKNHIYCDQILAPSVFAKQVFIDSNIPKEKITVISHGIPEEYLLNTTIKLPTKKRYKILANIAQNHLRKNIPGLLEAYGKAFLKNDDVCLLIKGKDKKVVSSFEVSLGDCLKDFNKRFPQHAEIKLLNEFYPDLSSLYRSVDTVFTMTYGEGFYFPGLEGIASGKLSIAPNWGGQIDFLDSTNSLLISGKEIRANPKSMYWESNVNAVWFEPSIDDAVDKLRYAYQNYTTLNEQIEKQRSNIYQKYSWNAVADQIIKLTL